MTFKKKIITKNYRQISILTALVGFLTAAAAFGCPIPVFQYALENWQPDPYRINIYYSNELTEKQQEAVDLLEKAQSGEDTLANIKVNLIDTAQKQPADYPDIDFQTLPMLEAKYPAVSRLNQPFWKGELTGDNVKSLLHSDLRDKIAKKLIDWETAVWILLEGEDKAQNDAVESLLKRELSRLEQTLVLPSSAEWEEQTVQIHDEISFEVIRLNRKDANEQMFIKMLLNSEMDLLEFGDLPIAFPIYGRGLVMYALINKGINAWTIREAGEFLAGPCSCQIKASNPGLDIIMSVNWEQEIEFLNELEAAAPIGAGSFLKRMEEAEKQLDDE